MNKLRYILIIQNSNIFKEVDVYVDTPLLKIGALQDCDMRLKRELFNSICPCAFYCVWKATNGAYPAIRTYILAHA